MLLVLLICLGLVSVNGDCIDGFMDYELLKQKASQIPDQEGSAGNLSLARLGNNKEYVMPSLNFTCSGVITGFLLGVDIRIDRNRAQFPKIRLLTVTGSSSYTLVSGSEREIILNADDFSTSGLYNYTLPVPLEFNGSQIMGAQQLANSVSRVKIYYQSFEQDLIWVDRSNDNSSQFSEASDSPIKARPLVLPLTDKSECLSGFIPSHELEQQVKFISRVNKTYDNNFGTDLFYKDIGFTCNGAIAGVVVGAEDNTTYTTNPPEIRIYRSNGIGGYNQTGPVIPLYYNNATSDVSTQYLRWYNLSEPVSVLDGDILGIYQPTSQEDSIIYYQRFNGPANYHANNMPTGFNMYPLVSVVFEIIIETTSLQSSATSSSVGSTSTVSVSTAPSLSIIEETTQITSITQPSSISMPISTMITTTSSVDIITTSNSIHSATSNSVMVASSNDANNSITAQLSSAGERSETMSNNASATTTAQTSRSLTQLTSGSDDRKSSLTKIIPGSVTSTRPTTSVAVTGRSSNGGSLVGGIAAVIIVLAIIALVVAVVIIALVVKRRRGKGKHFLQQDGDQVADGFSNAMYQSAPINSINSNDMDNPVYGADSTVVSSFNMYEPVSNQSNCTNGLASIKDLKISDDNLGADLNCISNVMYESTAGETQLYNTIQFGVCVPTNAQRDKITGLEENEENIYGIIFDDDQSTVASQASFFTEEPIYWDPENNTKGIYEQLAQKKYREIPRHEIRVLDHLGSGQFGTVDKGVWNTPKGQVEVAIKTLKGASEEDELKFLQEAAINGQFHHPNVVQLCGVVTVGEPTMIVLEYISNGDLKSYLESIRPVPRQLPDSSLPTLLMKFSHQVSCGMVYLSRKRFVHRDLAARNILVANGTVCKIADFGMSRNLQDDAYYKSNNKIIPVKWTAPEAIYYRKYSTQSDVWSFGAVLYEIWSVGHKPFEEYTNQECIKMVESGYRLPSPPGCPRSVYQIMIDCWHPVSADRPTFECIRTQLSRASFSQPDDDTLSSLGTTVYVENGCHPELQNKYL